MSKDLPAALAEENKGLDALLDSLEMGPEVPSPEVPAPAPEAPVATPTAVETLEDDAQPLVKPDLEKQLERADHRYRTLEGMMKADRKRQAEIISELEQQLAAQRVAEAEAPLDVGALLTEEEAAQFGEEGIRVLEKLAGAIAVKEVSKKALEVEQQLRDMQKRVDHAEAATEGNTTWDLVEKINPGSKEINASDQGWFAFLETVDPVSGSLYRDIGQAAASVNDIQRLSQLIDTYRTAANLAKPAIPVKPNQAPVALKNNDGNRQLESDKRVYSQEEIREFYDHRARNIRKGMTANLTEEQILALEVDIDAALEDGRVRL